MTPPSFTPKKFNLNAISKHDFLSSDNPNELSGHNAYIVNMFKMLQNIVGGITPVFNFNERISS